MRLNIKGSVIIKQLVKLNERDLAMSKSETNPDFKITRQTFG
jgi:hypothetical protein